MRYPGDHKGPLFFHAAQSPDRPALIWEGEVWNYQTLAVSVVRCAGNLERYGISPGTHVGVVTPNSRRELVLFLALWLRDAVIVPVNHRLTSGEIIRQLRNADIGLCFFQDLPDNPSTGIKFCSIDAIDRDTPSPDLTISSRPSGDDLAAIFHTSGTTGDPKGVRLSHLNFYSSALSSAINLGIDPEDRWLACLPLDHIGGFSILTRSLVNGTAIELHKEFNAEKVLQSLRENSITLLSLVPTMLDRLLKAGLKHRNSLRGILLGGGSSPDSLLERAAEIDLPILKTFGMTETCSQVVTTPLEMVGEKLQSAGQPLPLVDLKILDDEHGTAPPRASGEICIRGPMIMKGYYNDPVSTEEYFHRDYLRTGDYGYLDSENYLHIDARRTDRIVTGGENVDPVEVEAALRKLESIQDVCVFGKPHESWGEEVCAAVVPAEGFNLTLAECREFALPEIAGYKRPKHYFIIEKIPRNATGKPLRRKLREHLTRSY